MKAIRVIFLVTGVLLTTRVGWAQTSTPSSLTTSNKPVLEPSGAPASPFSSLPSALTTVGLPTLSSLKEQKDAYVSSIVPDLGLKLKKKKETKTDRKQKKKLSATEYAGLPILKAYTKIGSGDRTIVEEFYVLKDNEAAKPLPYVPDVYRYYQRSGRVSPAMVRDEGTGLLLHGPYKRLQNGHLVEEGFYYAGMKDGRWERYDSKFLLLDKTYWHQGLPAESRITYYDSTHRKIRDIVPIEYGKVQGTYRAYYENGLVAEEGKYDNGVKVGRWTEFYPVSAGGRRMRRKLTQYARDQWDTDFESYVLTEWDQKGNVTYQREKQKVIDDAETDN